MWVSCALPKCQTGTNWRPAIWITLAVTMNSRFLRVSLRLVYDQFMEGARGKPRKSGLLFSTSEEASRKPGWMYYLRWSDLAICLPLARAEGRNEQNNSDANGCRRRTAQCATDACTSEKSLSVAPRVQKSRSGVGKTYPAFLAGGGIGVISVLLVDENFEFTNLHLRLNNLPL